jgi:uncharacterized protein (DUF2147 family)
MALAAPRAMAQTADPMGVWLIDGKAAVQVFDCAGLLCGRIVWLLVPRDPRGQLLNDEKNPVLALRMRPLCGPTIIWGLHPAGPDRWQAGWFYNPDDGKTYRLSALLKSADVFVTRIYSGIPILGKTKTLLRIPRGAAEGWC